MNIERQRGFTLLELLVVMVIIGLLVGYVGPRYFSQLGKSEVNAARAQIKAISTALDMYRLDIGSYPNQEQNLEVLLTSPENSERWRGPYLESRIPLDPWGNKYIYRIPGELNEFDLYSLGRDGQPGGTGENAEIHRH